MRVAVTADKQKSNDRQPQSSGVALAACPVLPAIYTVTMSTIRKDGSETQTLSQPPTPASCLTPCIPVSFSLLPPASPSSTHPQAATSPAASKFASWPKLVLLRSKTSFNWGLSHSRLKPWTSDTAPTAAFFSPANACDFVVAGRVSGAINAGMVVRRPVICVWEPR